MMYALLRLWGRRAERTPPRPCTPKLRDARVGETGMLVHLPGMNGGPLHRGRLESCTPIPGGGFHVVIEVVGEPGVRWVSVGLNDDIDYGWKWLPCPPEFLDGGAS